MTGMIIDIAIVVLAIIILIVWTIRGCADSICMWMSKLGCFCIAIFVSMTLTTQLSALIPLSDWFAELISPLMSSFSAETAAGYSQTLYEIVVGAILFLVVFLACIYLVKLFKYIFGSINKIGFFKLLDKTLGAIFSLVASYLLIVILLSVVEIGFSMVLTTYLTNIMDIVSSSSILTIIHNTNFIGQLLASSLGITLPII